KAGTGIIFIASQGKSSQRKEVDAISILQNIQIRVSHTVSDHGGYTAGLSCRRSHPYDIMIPPLYIYRMVVFQYIHDLMGSRTSVVNVSQHMKMVHYQTLDQF